MTDYVTKPINRHHLFESLNACLVEPDPSCVPRLATIDVKKCDERPALHVAPDDSPCIDIEEFTDRCMGKPHLVVDLLQMFAEAMDERAAELTKYLSERSIDRVIGAAHSLKGMSANVSAGRVRDVAGRLEEAAREGHVDQCVEMESKLLAEVESCRTEIARVIGRTSAETSLSEQPA
jgi:HPt (histidine-containing phosphotransfer) domain-containing protein